MPGKPSDKGVFGLSVNKMRSPWIPALTALLLGGAGWGLEYRLFHFDLDDRGLIRPGAASAVLLYAVSGIAVLLIFLMCIREVRQQPGGYRWTALLRAAAAAMLGFSAWSGTGDPLSMASAALGGAAALCCIGSAVTEKLRFSANVLSGLFFASNAILRYRLSSSDPQLQDYVFPLLAEVALMLFCHHAAAVDAGMDKPQKRAFWRYSALYFCVVAAYNGGAAFLLLPVWLLLPDTQS